MNTEHDKIGLFGDINMIYTKIYLACRFVDTNNSLYHHFLSLSKNQIAYFSTRDLNLTLSSDNMIIYFQNQPLAIDDENDQQRAFFFCEDEDYWSHVCEMIESLAEHPQPCHQYLIDYEDVAVILSKGEFDF